ncbi:MAG: YfaP family protein [Porticoccaceae bacterium]
MFTNKTTRLSLLPIILACFLLSACGGGGDDTPDVSFGNDGSSDGFNPKGGSDTGDSSGEEPVVIEEDPVLDDIAVSQGSTSVLVPGRSLLEVIDVTISSATLSNPLPQGATQIGDAIDVVISDEDQQLLNGPVTVTMAYDPAAVQTENNLLVLYANGTDYEPVTIIERNEQENTLTFESRRFSTFVLIETDGSSPATLDTAFLPEFNGWDIANFGAYFSPGGNSFGMSGYAIWFYSEGATPLSGTYTELVAEVAAARVQMAQAETWGVQSWRQAQVFKDEDLALLLRTYMAINSQPLVLTLGGETSPTLAVVVYGYDEGGFYFYDPNLPGQSQYLTFDGTSFGAYGTLSAIGYTALSSFGTDADFAALSQEAAAGFPGSENLAIDNPQKDQLIDARETSFNGSFLNDLSEETSLYIEVKGVGRQLSVTNGTFTNVIEISSGTNTIVALAGVDASTENNWFRDAPTVIREVQGTLPPARLLVTLTWEQDETDVDLYITEPEGETMWYGGSRTTNGLELDIDDTTGFGPEHGTLEIGATTQALEGEYIVRVHYFSDDGLGVDATGRVTIVINEGEPEQNTLSLRFRIADDNSSEGNPGGTGTSWVDIARVDIINNSIDTDFSDTSN